MKTKKIIYVNKKIIEFKGRNLPEKVQNSKPIGIIIKNGICILIDKKLSHLLSFDKKTKEIYAVKIKGTPNLLKIMDAYFKKNKSGKRFL